MAKTRPDISAQRVIVTSFLVDLSDVIFSLIVAIMSGSVVMLSETLQGAADLMTSGLLLNGLHRSRRKPNKHYKFGHGRELFFWVLIAGVTMFVLTGSLSLYIGVNRILHPQPIRSLWLAFLALAIGLSTNLYALSLSLRRLRGAHIGPKMWERLRHSSLIETKATLILDMMGALASSFGFLALFIYGLTGNERLDGVGSVLIGLTIAVLAVSLIMNVKELLVGRSATSDIEVKIRQAATELKDVRDVLDLRTMYLGSEQLLVNIEIHVEDDLTTDELEVLIDKVKRRVKRRVPIVSHIQVELETPSIRE